MIRPITSLVLFSLLFFTSGWAVAAASDHNLTFGLVSGTSAFFEPVKDGWETMCNLVGANCHYIVPDWSDYENETYSSPCVAEMSKLIKQKVDGIAVACAYDAPELFQEAADAGIPVVTFDSPPPPEIAHEAYIGTDNSFLGRTLARLLKQLRPEGGTFALIAGSTGNQGLRVNGFTEEIMKHNDRDASAHWYAVERNFTYREGWHMEMMENYALLNPTAMIIMYQSPMRDSNWTDFVDANRHRNITYVGTDGSDYQLSYLSRRYVDGLVGQLPYDFGYFSGKTLYDLVTKGTIEKKVIATNLVAYNLIPLELPALDVDQNLLGNLKYIGFTCFGLVALICLACVAWTLYNRACMVVTAAQPFFLMMTAGGVLLMASTLVPLSFDDQGDPNSMTTTRSIGICMSVPWLAFTGFTVTFSALFSKTWRVNKFFHSPSVFGRIQVSVKDVLAPFAFLLTCNFIVLTCWTVLDPLTYDRQIGEGTDYWNRDIVSHGTCTSDHVTAYLVTLGLINFSVLIIACWQAFQARDIKSEFTEAKYIGLTVFSMSQAFLTGIPIVALVREIPETFYLVLTLLIFILCMVILLLIFLPKVLMQRAYGNMSAADRTKMMATSVRKSAMPGSSISGLNSVRDGSNVAFSSKTQDGSAGCFSLKADNLSAVFKKTQDLAVYAPFEKASGAFSCALSPPLEDEDEAETKEEVRAEEEDNDDLTAEDEVANDVVETKGCFRDDNNRGGHSGEDPLWSACGTTTVDA